MKDRDVIEVPTSLTGNTEVSFLDVLVYLFVAVSKKYKSNESFIAKRINADPERVKNSLKKLRRMKFLKQTVKDGDRIITVRDLKDDHGEGIPLVVDRGLMIKMLTTTNRQVQNPSHVRESLLRSDERTLRSYSLNNILLLSSYSLRVISTKGMRARVKGGSVPKNEEEKLFVFWNNLPNTKNHKKSPKTKNYQEAIQSIKEAVAEHGEDKVKQAMVAYDELLGSPFTFVFKNSAWSVSISEFFKTNRKRDFVKTKLKYQRDAYLSVSSWFNECLEKSEEELWEKFSLKKTKDRKFKESYPKLCKLFRKYWKSYLSSFHSRKSEYQAEFSKRELMIVDRAVNALRAYWILKKKKFLISKSIEELIQIFFESFLHGKQNFRLHYFYNTEIFERDFHYWLVDNQYLEEKRSGKKRSRSPFSFDDDLTEDIESEVDL